MNIEEDICYVFMQAYSEICRGLDFSVLVLDIVLLQWRNIWNHHGKSHPLSISVENI